MVTGSICRRYNSNSYSDTPTTRQTAPPDGIFSEFQPMRSLLAYLLFEFVPLTIAALMGVVLFWSWLTGQTISQTVFVYAGNL